MPHRLVQQLIDVVDRQETAGRLTSLEVLDVFWEKVAEIGTPLIEETAHGTRATFLFREHVDHLITADAYTGVWVEWRQPYADADVALQRLERTDVWWAEIEIPPDFTGMYTYVVADRDGMVTEDIHEPWPMSSDDEFNPRKTTDFDKAYPSNLLTTKALTADSKGSTSTILVPADLLPLPVREVYRSDIGKHTEPHPESYPVWCYTPKSSAWETHTTTLPLIVLMAGQFLESMDLAATLDHAVECGNMPPAVVAAPGDFREGHKAWGWRNGFGPGELSGFFLYSLLPTLARELPVEPIAHLVAWGYTTYSAFETARRIPGQVRSITLFNPSRQSGLDDWSIADAASDLSRRAPGFPIAIGLPPARDGNFAWRYYNDDVVRSGIEDADAHLVDFPVSDPNIVAAGEALGSAIAAVAPSSHGIDEAYIAAHPITEPAPSLGSIFEEIERAADRALLEYIRTGDFFRAARSSAEPGSQRGADDEDSEGAHDDREGDEHQPDDRGDNHGSDRGDRDDRAGDPHP